MDEVPVVQCASGQPLLGTSRSARTAQDEADEERQDLMDALRVPRAARAQRYEDNSRNTSTTVDHFKRGRDWAAGMIESANVFLYSDYQCLWPLKPNERQLSAVAQ